MCRSRRMYYRRTRPLVLQEQIDLTVVGPLSGCPRLGLPMSSEGAFGISVRPTVPLRLSRAKSFSKEIRRPAGLPRLRRKAGADGSGADLPDAACADRGEGRRAQGKAAGSGHLRATTRQRRCAMRREKSGSSARQESGRWIVDELTHGGRTRPISGVYRSERPSRRRCPAQRSSRRGCRSRHRRKLGVTPRLPRLRFVNRPSHGRSFSPHGRRAGAPGLSSSRAVGGPRRLLARRRRVSESSTRNGEIPETEAAAAALADGPARKSVRQWLSIALGSAHRGMAAGDGGVRGSRRLQGIRAPIRLDCRICDCLPSNTAPIAGNHAGTKRDAGQVVTAERARLAVTAQRRCLRENRSVTGGAGDFVPSAPSDRCASSAAAQF